MSLLLRYEILVPLLYNDGSPVPEFVTDGDHRRVESKICSGFMENQTVRGTWEDEGVVFRDNLTRFFVDVPDLPEHRVFFKGFKEKLKRRFNQLDVWITSHPVDVI